MPPRFTPLEVATGRSLIGKVQSPAQIERLAAVGVDDDGKVEEQNGLTTSGETLSL